MNWLTGFIIGFIGTLLTFVIIKVVNDCNKK